MAKANSSTSEATTETTAAAAPVVSMSLTDFCIRLSETVRRPELIGAFEATEREAGRVKASEADFRQRFDEFIQKPV